MFYRSHPDLVCDTIVGGHLPKRDGGQLESLTVYVLVTKYKFNFYNIVEITGKK